VPKSRSTEPPAAPPRWASREEAAAYSSLSLRVLDDRIAKGLIHAHRVPGGRRVVIDLNQIDELILSGSP
jgi:hypothetical protein